MKHIKIGNGETIGIEDGTDERTIEILKAATPCVFTEFVYTGNSSQGRNSGNYEDVEAWLKAAGLEIVEGEGDDDDLSILLYSLEKTTGIHALEHRGKRLRYHVQRRQMNTSHDSFGYRWCAEFRLISCDRRLGGTKPGAGKPPTTPGAGLAAALDRAESSVKAIGERGDIRYEEAAALFARADALSERIERLMIETPDYKAE